MIQNSEEWYVWRKGGIGSSDAPIIMGISPYKSPLMLYQEKIDGSISETKASYIQEKGHRLEPKARALLEIDLGITLPAKTIQWDEPNYFRASLDGYNENEKVIAEFKYVGKEKEEIPKHYYCQMQYQLLITGAKKCYYVAYDCDKSENVTLHPVKEVLPDLEYQKRISEKCIKFWE